MTNTCSFACAAAMNGFKMNFLGMEIDDIAEHGVVSADEESEPPVEQVV